MFHSDNPVRNLWKASYHMGPRDRRIWSLKLSLATGWILVELGYMRSSLKKQCVNTLLCPESFVKRSITKLCLLASALCCEDLPSGEAQHQSPWVWRTLWTASVALPSGEPWITHCCSQSDITLICENSGVHCLTKWGGLVNRETRVDDCTLVPAM